jgi:transcription elongation GreA/GreB family factor
MKLKENIYNHYLQVINDRISSVKQLLSDLKETGSNETKSTAGDKHETALAMIQIEQANTLAQLQDLLEKKSALEKINPLLSAPKVVIGSLIKTSRGYLYMSIALGKATINDIIITTVSPKSPLGLKLMGLTVGDVAEINCNIYCIENIQ